MSKQQNKQQLPYARCKDCSFPYGDIACMHCINGSNYSEKEELNKNK